MTLRILVVSAYLLLLSGCSIFLAKSGTNLEAIKTQEQVAQYFSDPVERGEDGDRRFEIYHTRRKVSEPIRAAGNGMGLAMTIGLSEFIAFPFELYQLGKGTLIGRELRFCYDQLGNVREVTLDGDSVLLGAQDPFFSSTPEPNTEIDSIELQSVNDTESSREEILNQ